MKVCLPGCLSFFLCNSKQKLVTWNFNRFFSRIFSKMKKKLLTFRFFQQKKLKFNKKVEIQQKSWNFNLFVEKKLNNWKLNDFYETKTHTSLIFSFIRFMHLGVHSTKKKASGKKSKIKNYRNNYMVFVLNFQTWVEIKGYFFLLLLFLP
jgi:hypothetical protein